MLCAQLLLFITLAVLFPYIAEAATHWLSRNGLHRFGASGYALVHGRTSRADAKTEPTTGQ